MTPNNGGSYARHDDAEPIESALMQDDYILENRLHVARAERRMTQADLARAAGVARQTISAIETRQYNPSAKLALVLARCLEMDVNELFMLVDEKGQEEAE